MKHIKCHVAAVLASVLCIGPVAAATYTVTSNADSGPNTLRAALLDMATRPAEDHTVTLAIAGSVIQLASPLPAIRGRTVLIDASAFPDVSVDGALAHRVFEVGVTAPLVQQLTLRGFRVARGRAISGGCLFDPPSPPRTALIILEDMQFSQCGATGASGGLGNRGGAVYASTRLSVRRSRFTSNAASNATGLGDPVSGGAIDSIAGITIANSEFRNNTATATSPAASALGGAVVSVGDLTIVGSHFTGNNVTGPSGTAFGGVVGAVGAAVTVVGSSFTNHSNTALATSGPATIENTSFYDNAERPSLFVFPDRFTVRINNSTFTRTTGPGFFGTAHLALQLTPGQTPDVQVANTLFGPTNGAAEGCGVGGSLAVTGGGYNLASDGSCDVVGNGTSQVLASSLGIGAPQATGTRAFVLSLAPDSPAIDAANPSPPGFTADSCIDRDARGAPRPVDGDGDGTARCDVGAFEQASDLVFRDGFE